MTERTSGVVVSRRCGYLYIDNDIKTETTPAVERTGMGVRRQGGAAQVVPLGATSGPDMSRVFLEHLAPGRYAVSVWRGGRHTFLVSDGVARGLVASIVRHAFERHSPAWHDESWTIEVCDTANCAQAQVWAVRDAAAAIKAAAAPA